MPIPTDPAAVPGLPHVSPPDLLLSLRRLPPPVMKPAATIIPFPPPPAARCRDLATDARTLAERIDVDHLVLLEVAAELLALDDQSFAARLHALRGDAEGRSILDDMMVSLQGAIADFESACRALLVLRLRVTAGLVARGGADVA